MSVAYTLTRTPFHDSQHVGVADYSGTAVGTVGPALASGRWAVTQVTEAAAPAAPGGSYESVTAAAHALLGVVEEPPPLLDNGLTAIDKRVLDLELAYAFAPDKVKEHAVTQLLGMTYTRYVQRLNNLINSVEGAAYAPVIVGRLRRLRDARITQITREGAR